MYAKVKDLQVICVGLPACGALSDGRTVSNYYLLPPGTLAEEGWLPCEEVKPEYNPDSQYLEIDTKEVKADKVILTYRAVNYSIE